MLERTPKGLCVGLQLGLGNRSFLGVDSIMSPEPRAASIRIPYLSAVSGSPESSQRCRLASFISRHEVLAIVRSQRIGRVLTSHALGQPFGDLNRPEFRDRGEYTDSKDCQTCVLCVLQAKRPLNPNLMQVVSIRVRAEHARCYKVATLCLLLGIGFGIESSFMLIE